MKFLRYGPTGKERPGVLDADNRIRDLSAHCRDIDPAADPNLLDRLAAVDVESLPVVQGSPRLGPPLRQVGKFIAIGLNYRDHAIESNLPIPTEPVIFTKATSCIVGPDDDIVLPPGSVRTDWEVELGIVIGRRASHVPIDRAREHVAGYLLVHDVSEREYQIDRGGTWDKGKGCDTFGPLGPWLVSRDEVDDPQALDLSLDVNGEPRQRGNTRTMIFGCDELVSYVSRFMTLLPGDVITTGTPPGVGMGMKPPVYLKAGDVVSLSISGLGSQRQTVRAFPGSAA